MTSTTLMPQKTEITPPPLHLMIPGPTPLPDSVRTAMGRPALGHRSPEFKTVIGQVNDGLQWVFQTQHPVFCYAASGTGGMEAAFANTLNPGDAVLVLVCGVFSQRWATMARMLGATVTECVAEPGSINSVAQLTQALQEAPTPYKMVVITHSETSTGVLNPLQALAETTRRLSPDTLICVDAVTSLGASPLYTDAWDLDLVMSGSQKGLMIPPGLAFLSVSPRAWAAYEACQHPSYYFNFGFYKKAFEGTDSPFTPATHLMLALAEAFRIMQGEGLDAIQARHAELKRLTREGVQALGLTVLVPDATNASDAVTAIEAPKDMSVADLRQALKGQHGFLVADGQAALKGKIFRIGHLGFQFPRDTQAVLTALAEVLKGSA